MSCCNTKNTPAATETRGPAFQPTVDIHETPSEWVLTADVPGATREGLEVSFEDGVLTVHARVPERGPEGASFVRREYPVGDFHRAFRIGEGVDTAAIGAALEAGVLTVRLPKSESLKPRKIEVKGA